MLKDTANAKRIWALYGDAQVVTGSGEPYLLFDGDADYMAGPSPSELGFGTGDFKITFKASWGSFTGYQTVLSCGYTVDNPNSFIVQTGKGDGLLNVYCKNTLVCGETFGSAAVGEEYDFEVSRVDGVTVIKRGGVVTASGVDTNDYPNEQFSFGGGSSFGFNKYWFNGTLKNIKITF